MLVYINGELVPEDEAVIPVLDHGFLYGDGVFEGVSVDDGRIFRLTEHVARLFRSAEQLRISSYLSPEEVADVIENVAAVNDLRDGYIRPILSRGTGPMGIGYTREITRPNIVVIPQVRPRLSDKQRLEEGLQAVVLDRVRTPSQCLDPSIKSNNYLNQVLGKFEAWDASADFGIMLDLGGNVSECCGENIFVVDGTILRTPPPGTILNGITRQAVLDLWRRDGGTAREELLMVEDLYAADECFVTATLIEVAAVTKIDGRAIGAGTPGPVTWQLLGALRREMSQTGHVVSYPASPPEGSAGHPTTPSVLS
jgi:branched-chain amino acid aminotransferase